MNVHDKYVIEIEKVFEYSLHGEENLGKIKGFNTLVFDQNGLNKLERFDDAIEDIKDEWYEKGYSDGSYNSDKLSKTMDAIENEAYKRGFTEGSKRVLSSVDLVDKFNKGYDKGFEEGKQHVIRAVAHHIDKTNDIVNILQIIDEYENDIEKKFSNDPLNETVDYIEHLKSTGLGKMKALNYLSKFIQEKIKE